MLHLGHNLDTLVQKAKNLIVVYKADLHPGDWVIVKTHNSIYRLHAEKDGFYQVTGGWFDSQGISPARLKITGCTWGGSVIKMDIVAACGLCLEFSNRVVTSPIQKIWHAPNELQN
jgi:hypothetical protein